MKPLEITMPPIAVKRQDAARLLSMSDESFDKWVRTEIRSVRCGALTLYPLEELQAWARKNAQQTLRDAA